MGGVRGILDTGILEKYNCWLQNAFLGRKRILNLKSINKGLFASLHVFRLFLLSFCCLSTSLASENKIIHVLRLNAMFSNVFTCVLYAENHTRGHGQYMGAKCGFLRKAPETPNHFVEFIRGKPEARKPHLGARQTPEKQQRSSRTCLRKERNEYHHTFFF